MLRKSSFAWPRGACGFSGLAYAKDACESVARDRLDARG